MAKREFLCFDSKNSYFLGLCTDLYSYLLLSFRACVASFVAFFTICFGFHNQVNKAIERWWATLDHSEAKQSIAIDLKDCLFEVRLKLATIIFSHNLSDDRLIQSRSTLIALCSF